MKHFALRIACLFAAAGSRIAFAAPAAEPIRESERKQVQLQGETRQLVGALDAMLGEYERNNLSGEDVATVRRLRQSLDTLTTAEMRQVVDLLQKARAGADEGTAVKLAADAFSAQKQVIVAIERILAEHLREQEAAEIARQLNDLADRQARNLQNGIELGRMTAGTKPENFEALYQAQLETQRGEQAAIAAELPIARRKLEKFAADPDNADVAAPFKNGAQQIAQIEPVAAGAAEALKAGQLFKAATDEKTSREELRKVARQIAPRDRGSEALRKAEQQLAKLVEDQKQLSTDTARQRTNPDFEKWLEERLAAKDTNSALPSKFRNQPASALRQNKELRERFENEQHEKAAQLAKLEDQQGELVAKTDALGQDVAQAPKAAEELRKAMEKMQEARAAMQEANAPQAVKQQDDALAQLDAAHADIKRRADEAELLAGKSDDKAKDLEGLRQLADELARQEEALAKNSAPDAAAQGDLARRANQLAQRIPAAAPNAGPSAQAAAANAKKSEQAMEAGKAAESQEAARQAAQDFAETAKQIGEQLAQEKAAPARRADADDVAQLAQAAEDLAKAQQQIQRAQDNLRQASENGGQQAREKMQQASQQLAKAAQQAAQAAAQHGTQMPPGAQQAATQGSQQAASAAAQATAGDNSGAQQSAQAASQSLAQAQGAMAAMQAGISPSQGGAPMPGAQGMGKPGRGNTPGPGKGSAPSSQATNQPSDGATEYKPGDPRAVQRGARAAALGAADFIGLPQREREAIRQSLREKYPEEYGALVEQYLLNLANESAKKQQR